MVDPSFKLQGKDVPKLCAREENRLISGFISLFSSLRLTVILLSLIALTVLIGAWCPQEAQVGQEKVIEQFGTDLAFVLIKLGIADIFHSLWFLLLIGLISINMIVGSLKRVFPKLRLLKKPLPFLTESQIKELKSHSCQVICKDKQIVEKQLTAQLKRFHYRVASQSDRLSVRLNGEFGKYGRLAPSVTHVGLLTLLLGVTITAWTGFSGFKPVPVGSDLTFTDCQHAALWLGSIPNWRVHVNASRRENYENGDAKQWFSNLTVVDSSGRKIITQDISVNNPLSYQGVDIYQSSWDIGQLELSFNGRHRHFDLQPMGKLHAAFLPLDDSSVLIFSVHDQNGPLRIFAKRPDWQAPKLIGMVPLGKEISLGSVKVGFVGTIANTGLQYKCDPGLVITLPAFFLIASGVLLAAVPHRQLWAEMKELNANGKEPMTLVTLGGHSRKAKWAFEKQIKDLLASISQAQIISSHSELPGTEPPNAKDEDRSAANFTMADGQSKNSEPEAANLPLQANNPKEVVRV
jgi:cytochrome c biogenesis protein